MAQGLIALWQKGMQVKDLNLLYQLNKEAKVIVETPVGNTSEFWVDEIVKQGTIWGPKMCCTTTDEINKFTEDAGTSIGTTNVDCRIFVDDMASIGNETTIKNAVDGCCYVILKNSRNLYSQLIKARYLELVEKMKKLRINIK